VSRSGLIPARAGNTRRQLPRTRSTRAHPRSRGEHSRGGSARRRVFWAHPRSRGEHGGMVERVRLRAGSSPLARGTPYLGAHVLQARGLIPARAGNTNPANGQAEVEGAHPRSRGEHPVCKPLIIERHGSSPLARGTHIVLNLLRDFRGLIPARAGNTILSLDLLVCSWAHPRSRGEHRCSGWS